MKQYFFIFFILSSVSIFSFGQKEEVINAKNDLIAGLILDEPGLDDGAINASSYSGLQKASDEGLITLRTITTENKSEVMQNLINDGVQIIILVGEKNKELLINASKKYLETQFIGIDIFLDDFEIVNNIIGITFREQEGSFLAGVLAGSLTYRFQKYNDYMNDLNSVGVILGSNDPDMKRYELGFYAGVKEINPSCNIITININDTNSAEKGKLALNDLKIKGVDIVFTNAGLSDEGVFEAAEIEDILVIGANKDLNSKSPNIITSVVKEMSISTYLVIKDLIDNGFQAKNIIYGLDVGALTLAPYYNYDKYIPKELRSLIDDKKEMIIKKSDRIPNSIDEIVFDIEQIPEVIN